MRYGDLPPERRWRMERHRPTRRKKAGPHAWRQGPASPSTADGDDQIITRRERALLLAVAAAWVLIAPDWGYVWDCCLTR